MSISKKRSKEIDAIPDEAIDTSDIPELDDEFWENAVIKEPINKKVITIRIDADILDWFRSQGKGYQTLINAVLKSYVEHNKQLR